MKPRNNIFRFQIGEKITSIHYRYVVTITDVRFSHGNIMISFIYEDPLDAVSRGGGSMPLKEFKKFQWKYEE